jgi:hypothetical protein
LFQSTSLKATSEAVFLINATFFEVIAANPSIKKIEGLQITPTYQTITTKHLQAAKASGGDPMDLDPKNGNIVGKYETYYCQKLANMWQVYLVATSWQNPADDAAVDAFHKKLFTAIETKAKKQGLYYAFKYLNDSPTFVKVFDEYGGGKSLPKLRAIAKAYGRFYP